MLRHERHTVAMELVAALHHSWGGELGKNVRQPSTLNSPLTMGRQVGSGIAGAAAAGASSAAHRGATCRLRSHGADPLDVPVPQMNQLVGFMKMYDCVTPKQVIAVPTISCPPRPLRAVLSEPQMTEHLVEVPTVVSPSCSSPSRTLTFQFLALAVPLDTEVFKVSSQNRVTSRPSTFQLVEVLKIFSQVLVRQLFLQFRVKSWARNFSHFSPFEKVRRSPGVRVRGCTGTRAHPRWRFRGRPPRSPTRSSTWSAMGVARRRYCWWLAAEDGSRLARSYGGPPVGDWDGGMVKAVVVASAPVIIQLSSSSPSCSCFWRCLRFSSIQSAGRSSCTQSVHGYGGRRSCEPQ